ncbi:phosphatase PAP2 family protein [Pseudomarimonas arenosa]|uniref:undecaprenyl-diphosphate phosphatase n=1 Tax=Pseudomarimonas arenosa TaxID=2774145 RepID=A0AAW3ZKS5_9GAMM|nr:phosphatase PAP2 family protein [Pseudomarimonas arenosa]MBD8525789.1 phosphatase PAP2 family protein [Pseudomarimonas arenosa]
MFQVEPILWLQQFSGTWFADFMWLMSEIGREWVYMPVVLLLMFAIRLRPGLGVVLALVLCGLLTASLKHGFALPRPADVDLRVVDKGEEVRALVADGAGKAFWDLPSNEAIAAVRAEPDPSFGFVSGHVASALTLVLSLALFFGVRSRWVWGFVVIWPLLMGLSRMFLGRHFLADVLGGLLIGTLASLLAWWLLPRLQRVDAQGRWLTAALVGACAIGAGLGTQISWLSPGGLGQVAGVVLCIAVLALRGMPLDAVSLPRRIGRLLLALLIATSVDIGVKWVYAGTGLGDDHFGAFLAAVVGYLLGLGGAVMAAQGLRLYAPGDQALHVRGAPAPLAGR